MTEAIKIVVEVVLGGIAIFFLVRFVNHFDEFVKWTRSELTKLSLSVTKIEEGFKGKVEVILKESFDEWSDDLFEKIEEVDLNVRELKSRKTASTEEIEKIQSLTIQTQAAVQKTLTDVQGFSGDVNKMRSELGAVKRGLQAGGKVLKSHDEAIREHDATLEVIKGEFGDILWSKRGKK